MDEPKQTGETSDAGSIASEATVQVRSIISAAEGVADALKREAERRGEMCVREAEGEAARLIATAPGTRRTTS